MIVLGIESSCDETAAGIVENGDTLLANAVFTSMDLQKVYGGVVPEIAARSHIESIIPVIDEALQTAFPSLSTADAWGKIDAIAVTYGAGLGGSLLVGVMTARTLALTKNKPLYAINHVEAHVYANFLTSTSLDGYQLPATAPHFPLLSLIVSGGHSQLVLFNDHFDYKLLGQTRDDAIGEAFDKVAKIVGLPYPGGPSIAKAAKLGDPQKYSFPKAKIQGTSKALDDLRASMASGLDAMQGASEASQQDVRTSTAREQRSSATQQSAKSRSHGYEYSFSGPKTAVLRLAQEIIGEDYTFPSFKLAERLSEAQKNDIAASFQRIAVETVVDKTVLAFEEFAPKSVVIAGGVAANQELRRQLSDRIPIPIQYTDPKLCTDNGAMIATLGCFYMKKDQPTADPYTLAIEPNLSM